MTIRELEIEKIYFNLDQGTYFKALQYDESARNYYCEELDLNENEELVHVGYFNLLKSEVYGMRLE